MSWGRGVVWKCARLCLRAAGGSARRAGNLPHGAARSEEVRALRRGVEFGMEAADTAEMYGTEDLVGGVVRSCRERAFPVGKVLPENADCAGAKRACGADCTDLCLLRRKGGFPISEAVRALRRIAARGRNSAMAHGQSWRGRHAECPAASVRRRPRSVQRGEPWSGVSPCSAARSARHSYNGVYPFRKREGDVRRGVAEIARRRCATLAQIMLVWAVCDNVIAIPKAGGAEYAGENFRSLNAELRAEDLRDIGAAFHAPNAKNSPTGW